MWLHCIILPLPQTMCRRWESWHPPRASLKKTNTASCLGITTKLALLSDVWVTSSKVMSRKMRDTLPITPLMSWTSEESEPMYMGAGELYLLLSNCKAREIGLCTYPGQYRGASTNAFSVGNLKAWRQEIWSLPSLLAAKGELTRAVIKCSFWL